MGSDLNPSFSLAKVEICIRRTSLEKALKHATENPDHEVAGALVGYSMKPEDKDGLYTIRIIDSIAAKYTVNRGASVTFTADSWSALIRDIEQKQDDSLLMVGWYHTHPGYGVFFSGHDRFLHEHFFPEPWHVALVIDPQSNSYSFFAWNSKQSLSEYSHDKITFLRED